MSILGLSKVCLRSLSSLKILCHMVGAYNTSSCYTYNILSLVVDELGEEQLPELRPPSEHGGKGRPGPK